jgi:dihydroorotase
MVARDLYLAEYTGSKIHFTTVSTERSVSLIKEAKKKGIPVTCDVAVHHLLLTDQALLGFDSQYKVKPPLRTRKDVKALLNGLKDGTIDAITSQHTPHEVEFKNVEFEVAEFGMIGLQTAFSIALEAGLPVETIVQKMAINPRKILGLDVPVVADGSEANLVIFDSDADWTFDRSSNKSKSYNSPFMGKKLKGSILLCINNNKLFKS